MKPMNDRTQLVEFRPALPPTPRKRFRLEKLEERIAPKGSGRIRGTNTCTFGCG
jgi:hypothetical protein